MESSEVSRIVIDSVMITFVSAWVTSCSELGFLKKLFFFGIFILSALLLTGDIAIVLISRLNTLVECKMPHLMARLYPIKLAALLNFIGILMLFLVWITPVILVDKAAKCAIDILHFTEKSLYRLATAIKATKDNLSG